MTKPYGHELNALPKGAFIPTFLQRWAKITSFMPDVPAVELELTENDGLSGNIICWHSLDQNPKDKEFFPEAISCVLECGTEVFLIDERRHGWDAIQCDFKPEGERTSSKWACLSCGEDKFIPRFSWLGYQVFDEGWENSGSELMEFRDSFDSATIDVKCLKCGHVQEALYQGELA